MAKPWAEVSGSAQFQALSPTEQEAARQQYFDAVVAPKVPEADRDIARQQFFSSTTLPITRPASAASAPARTPAVETAADVLPTEPTSLFGGPVPAAPTPGFFPGEEFVKGLKAGVAGLKSTPGAIGAAGAAESLVAAQNRIALLDKIDAGQITSPRELRGQPGFDPRVGAYFASNPEVRAKLRAGVVNDLARDEKFMAASLAAFQKYRDEASKLRGRTEEATDIRSATDFGNWLSKSIGEAGVQLAPVMLSAIALKQPGLLATSAGMEFAGGVQNRMEFLANELKQLPPEQRAARVAKYLADTNDTTAAAALAAGSLDLVLGPAARAAKATAKEILEKSTRKGAAIAEAKRLPKDIAGEFVTGAAQEGIQIGAETKLGEQKQPVSWENVKRVINAAAKEAAGAPIGTAINVARAAAAAPSAPGAVPPEPTRVEPTMGEAPPEPTRVEPTMGEAPTAAEAAPETAPATDAQRLEELTQQGIEVGLPEEDARTRATNILAAETAERTRQEEAQLAPRVEALTQEFVDAGIEPTQARTRAVEQAKQEAEADAIAERELAAARGPVAPEPEPSGAGVEVARGPEPAGAPAGVEGAEPAGVAPAGRAAEVVAGREEAAPAAVEAFDPIAFAKRSADSALADASSFSSEQEAVGAYRDNVIDTLREQGIDESSVVNKALDAYDAAVAQPAGEVPAPKKRGRPAVLTPEEKAAKAAEKKPLQAAKMRAERAVTRLNKALNDLAQPIDLETISSDAALAEAEADRTAKRREAVKELLQLQADPNLRGTKVGERIKEALKHPSITPQELTNIKAGIEAQKRAAEQVSRAAVGGAPADSRFNKFTNGAQALSHVIKTGNAFQKLLGKRLRPFVAGVKFVVIGQGQELPEQLRSARNAAEWERARALYIENDITREKVIYVRGESFGDDQGVNNVTVLHELLHAATNRKVMLALDALRRGVRPTDPLVRAAQDLLRTMNSAVTTFNEMARTGQLPAGVRPIAVERGGAALTDPREFIAYGMTDENFQRFLMQARGYEEDTSFFNRFVRGVRKLFGMEEDTANALSDLILVTDTILSSRAPSRGLIVGETISPSAKEEIEKEPAVRTQKEVERAVNVANENFKESKKGEEYAKGISAAQMAQDPRKVAEALRGVWTNFTPNARAALTRVAPTDFLADLVGDAVPELKNTDKLMQKMSGLTTNLLKSAGKVTDEIDRAYRKDPSLREKLDEITFTSTIAEVDPSDPKAKERSIKLDRMWNALGPEGQRLYSRIKNHFAVLSDYFTNLLDEQITQSGLSIAERANVLQKVRALYEQGAKIQPYFPLVRRGDFWLGIGSGKTRKFFMYESAAERDRAMQAFADERIKQKPGESDAAFEKRRQDNLGDLLETQEYTYGNDISELRKATGDSSAMLKGVFEAIDSAKLGDDNAKNALKDAVYQIYLQTMPEQSFRRQFIHRKGYVGYRPDILRATADASTRMATQLARLKYGRLLRNSLSQARDSIANRPQYSEVVSAFERRVDEELIPTPQSAAERVAAGLNKASFIWYLGGASSALLQPLSIFQTGYPVLAAKHGFGKATAELMGMMKVWNQYGVYERNRDGSLSFKMPTVEHASGLTADERRAVQAMTDYGLTTSTYAGDVFDYKNTPSGNYSHPIVEFGKNTVDALVLGGLMHTTERISREVVFLSSYRLNRKAGKSHQEAIDQAVVDTKEALGNYGEYNRPEFMRGAAGRLLTQFMMYPVHVTLFLGRNFVEMIKPMSGRTRQEARRKFFGTLGTTFVLAGAVGLPMFSTAMGLLGWMWNQTKDEDEPEELRDMSFELWFRTKWMQEQLGEVKVAGKSLADVLERGVANAITGLDISGRTSLNNMWMRDTKEMSTVRDSAAALALEKAGPAANMVLSWAEAYEAFILGDYSKGVKKATPAGFRNFINAYEQYTEGAKDNKGAQILSRDAFTTGELIGQAVGFRSDLLANTQYVTFKVIGLEQKINSERTRLLNQLDREYRNKNVRAYTKYYKEMLEFNRKYPSYEIGPDDFERSMESKQERRAMSYRGVTLTEKNVGVLAPALVPSRRAATEKEKEGRAKREGQ